MSEKGRRRGSDVHLGRSPARTSAPCDIRRHIRRHRHVATACRRRVSPEIVPCCGTRAVAVLWKPTQSAGTAETSPRRKERSMKESVYNVVELIGTSEKSWEEAAKNAVETAGKSLRDLRVAEIVKLDLKVEKNKVVAYRARVQVSFKYEGKE